MRGHQGDAKVLRDDCSIRLDGPENGQDGERDDQRDDGQGAAYGARNIQTFGRPLH